MTPSALMTAPLPSSTLPLRIGVLWTPESIVGTAATVIDALRVMNTLSQLQGGPAAVVHWRWQLCGGVVCGPLPAEPPAQDPGADADCDLWVLPGWMATSGPHLRGLTRTAQAQAQAVLMALASDKPVLALFNASALLTEAGVLGGREVALPWPFAPSVLQGVVPAAHWQRSQAWWRHGALWTTAALPATLPALFDLLSHTPVRDLAAAAAHVLLFDARRQQTAPTELQTTTGAPTPSGALERARRWLQDHLADPYDLAATAQAAATSPRTLLRWFAQVHGESPLDHLHGLRVAQAQVLLQTTYLTVEAIAQQCGYSDVASFRRIFVRRTQMTPVAWRRRFRLRTRRKEWTGLDANPCAKNS